VRSPGFLAMMAGLALVSSPAAAGIVVQLPIAPGDSARAAYGLAPFGIHFSNHGSDGHPGIDFEYRLGASVLAAADGVVQSVFSGDGQHFVVQIMHTIGTSNYRTVYNSVTNVPANITPGASVSAGQPVGTAPSYTQWIGSSQITYAMTHFQLDDFSINNSGSTNPNAVNPEPSFSATAHQQFAAIWATAVYTPEFCEPFVGNPRTINLPLTRTWAKASGTLAQRIDFTRTDPGLSGRSYDYALYAGDGSLLESGTVSNFNTNGSPYSTLDLQPSGGGPARLGLYDIVSDLMRIDFAAPGAARPADLSQASAYSTPWPSADSVPGGIWVPEPGTVSLLLSGGMAATAVLAWNRRRKQQRA